MQETRVRSLVGELRSHMPQGNYARAPQLLSLRSRAHEPQLLKTVYLEPVLCNKRSHCNVKPTHRNEEQPPLAATREKPACSNKDPTQPKINKLNK